MPGVEEISDEPQLFYSAMETVVSAGAQLQASVSEATVDLLDLNLDPLFLVTTSTRHARVKDRRPHPVQATIGVVVTSEGIPLRTWGFPDDVADAKLMDRGKADLREQKPGRIVRVLDRRLAAIERLRVLERRGHHWIAGEKLSVERDDHAALDRAGDFRAVSKNLQVKEVTPPTDITFRGQATVCRDLLEADRDHDRREKELARLKYELAILGRMTGDARLGAESELLAHPVWRRYLSYRAQRLVLDGAKVSADARADGEYLIHCSDDGLDASSVASGYRQMLEIKRNWREFKQTFEPHPVHHSLEQRLHAHVLLCYLALLLVRVAEAATGEVWTNLRRDLQEMHLGEFIGLHGRLTQRTRTSPKQAAIFHALLLDEPPHGARAALADDNFRAKQS